MQEAASLPLRLPPPALGANPTSYKLFERSPQEDSPQTDTSKLSTGASKSLYQHVREPVWFWWSNARSASSPSAPFSASARCTPRILQEKSFNLNLSGNEVYCTNSLLFLMKIMRCSELRSVHTPHLSWRVREFFLDDLLVRIY